MDKIYIEHKENLSSLKTAFRRNFIDEIDWDEPLLFIVGSRGVGKTTLIIQHIKEQFGFDTKALYVSMDDLSLSNFTLVELAKNILNWEVRICLLTKFTSIKIGVRN